MILQSQKREECGSVLMRSNRIWSVLCFNCDCQNQPFLAVRDVLSQKERLELVGTWRKSLLRSQKQQLLKLPKNPLPPRKNTTWRPENLAFFFSCFFFETVCQKFFSVLICQTSWAPHSLRVFRNSQTLILSHCLSSFFIFSFHLWSSLFTSSPLQPQCLGSPAEVYRCLWPPARRPCLLGLTLLLHAPVPHLAR